MEAEEKPGSTCAAGRSAEIVSAISEKDLTYFFYVFFGCPGFLNWFG